MRRGEAGGGADHRGVVGAELDRRPASAARPARSQSSATASRSGPLAATPPPSATASHSPRFSARFSFAVSCPTTAAWKQAARSARRSCDPLRAEVAAAVDERRLQAAEAEVEAGVAGHRDRHLEGLRVALRGQPLERRAARVAEAEQPRRPCRRPRRRRRRGSGRAPRSPRGRGPPASSVWPPLATRQRKGGSSGSGSRKLAATWPCRWSTGISGRRRARGDRLGGADPDQQRADQARPGGDRDRLDVVERRPRPRPAPPRPPARPARGGGARRPRGRRRRSARGRRPARRSRWRGSAAPSSTAAQVSSQEVSIASSTAAAQSSHMISASSPLSW